MVLTPVIGTVFELTKACESRHTKPGMFAVVISYEKNPAKDRMEAELDVFADDAESFAKKVSSDMRTSFVQRSISRQDKPRIIPKKKKRLTCQKLSVSHL